MDLGSAPSRVLARHSLISSLLSSEILARPPAGRLSVRYNFTPYNALYSAESTG